MTKEEAREVAAALTELRFLIATFASGIPATAVKEKRLFVEKVARLGALREIIESEAME